MSKTPLPLDMAALESMPCQHCGGAPHGQPMALVQKCHPGRGLHVVYQNGVVTVRCNVCEKLVVHVAVAERVDPDELAQRIRAAKPTEDA